MSGAISTSDFVKTLGEQLKKMQKRLDGSEDALAQPGLDAESRRYHLDTVSYYRGEITKVRDTLISAWSTTSESVTEMVSQDQDYSAGATDPF